MKKNKLLIIMFLIVLLIFTACSKKDSEVAVEEVTNVEETEIIEEVEEIEDLDDINKIVSPLDGLKYYEEDLLKRPVVISIDNHPGARWQAGLSQAEIIYEVEVESPYTRYLCVFLAKEPKLVGPVRSARPYLINYALENDGIFVHVGGSQDAFNEIARLNVADIDGLYSGAMWRYYDTGKIAPHNMYTTLKSIRDEAVNKAYRTECDFEGYKFYEKAEALSNTYSDVKKAQKINIIYNNSNTTDYTYDKDNNLYLRFKDGEIHIDELDKKQLTAKNIIIIETSKQILDNEGRLFIDTVGSGNGTYITNGESIEITWNKNSEKERTKLYIGSDELILNPGNTWFQIVSNINGVKIE